ncbi:hypothetical protein CWATWH0005_3989 [Crocosphaera watsonii WH 0005]|uniref:Uncharacterized protein n=1 Tax=Crocosphaera watsonii WH 0005 TaxID=423472 RepID=T2IWV1_CROWT|nr:hypothetical protein CWATWH0005_3989 [Crocosphaera watsonii WH 0005]
MTLIASISPYSGFLRGACISTDVHFTCNLAILGFLRGVLLNFMAISAIDSNFSNLENNLPISSSVLTLLSCAALINKCEPSLRGSDNNSKISPSRSHTVISSISSGIASCTSLNDSIHLKLSFSSILRFLSTYPFPFLTLTLAHTFCFNKPYGIPSPLTANTLWTFNPSAPCLLILPNPLLPFFGANSKSVVSCTANTTFSSFIFSMVAFLCASIILEAFT